MIGLSQVRIFLTGAVLLFSSMASAAGYSGFLIDYPKLSQDPNVEGAKVWLSSPTPLKPYDRVRLERMDSNQPSRIWTRLAASRSFFRTFPSASTYPKVSTPVGHDCTQAEHRTHSGSAIGNPLLAKFMMSIPW